MTSVVDPRLVTQAGAQALGQGDFARARVLFEQIAATGRADGPVFLGLAVACRGLGDGPGKLAALDRLLALDPRHLRGLMLKADHFAEAGDARAAAAFCRQVLKVSPPADRLPPELAAELRRAQAMRDAYAADYERHLLDAVGPAAEGPGGMRFRESVELMLGRKRVYLQEPRHYYFPGLPQIQFYGREPFPWLAGLEAAAPAIRAELEALLRDGAAFSPYVKSQSDRPFDDGHGMRDNADWSALYLWRDGAPVEEIVSRCPATMAAMEALPLCGIAGRTPSILFSRLAAGAKIPPHNGFINTRLISHLPLIVPGKCGFRVGNEVREWREGEAWLFDDTIEHEAWNDSGEDRIILIFDVWRPELSEAERDLIAGLFAAVDTYGGGATAWGV